MARLDSLLEGDSTPTTTGDWQKHHQDDTEREVK